MSENNESFSMSFYLQILNESLNFINLCHVVAELSMATGYEGAENILGYLVIFVFF